MSDPSTTRDNSTCDVVIVGGGIIGLSSALALAQAGAAVIVVDAARGPATAASGAAAGIVSLLYPWECPDALQALASESIERYADWCAELTATSGIDTGWRQWGLLSHDCGDEPVLFPDVGAVEPVVLLDALHRAARAAGVRIQWARPVIALVTDGDRVCGVRCADGTLLADKTVIASGAWSAALVPDIAVRPVRGQIIELDAPRGALDRIVVSGHRYLLPRADGRIVVGSTVEEVGFDAAPTAAGAHDLRAFASGLLPASAAWPVLRHWAGLRPGSADGMPVIGPASGQPGLWLNTGHFRNGITLAPGSAARLVRLMAD